MSTFRDPTDEYFVHEDGTMECVKCGDRFRLAIFGDGPPAYQCSCGIIFGGFGVEAEWTDADNKPFEETVRRVAEMKRENGWRVGEDNA